MGKFLIYADPHWSTYSSIVRSRGKKYSTRLENLINTMNWIETISEVNGCDTVISLGDFFDKCDLSVEEITALQEIKWNNLKHIYLVGNHEMGRSNLEFSSSHLFRLCSNYQIIDKPCYYDDDVNNIVLLPYILEKDRKPLKEYLKDTVNNDKKTIILSHNDIKGMQMGQWKSTEGFTIDEISDNCNLFINGHLHNTTDFSNIINLGNITGQNFSEDAMLYPHQAMILDTTKGCFDYIENPYAFNFYKLDVTPFNYEYIKEHFETNLKTNAIVTVKVNSEQVDYVKEIISNCSNIIESKVIINITHSESLNNEVADLSIDHISKFKEYIKSDVGTSDKILDELEKIAGN